MPKTVIRTGAVPQNYGGGGVRDNDRWVQFRRCPKQGASGRCGLCRARTEGRRRGHCRDGGPPPGGTGL